jgi:hypothetical protein
MFRQTMVTSRFFEPMSKRRRGFPSETQVKRGVRIVHGNKLLEGEARSQLSLSVRKRSPLRPSCRTGRGFASASARWL